MKKLLIYSLLALSGFMFPACGDDEPQDDPQPVASQTKTELLTNRNWTFIEQDHVSGGLGTTPAPYYAQQPCQQDNYVKFETDGKVKRDEGATKCNPSAQQTTYGTWSFFDNENQIYIDQRTCQIIELTADRFKYKRTMVVSGETYIDIFTYEHK